MNNPSSKVNKETGNSSKAKVIKTENSSLAYFLSQFSPPEEPEILDDQIDQKTIRDYRRYINEIRYKRGKYLLLFVYILPALVIASTILLRYIISDFSYALLSSLGITRDYLGFSFIGIVLGIALFIFFSLWLTDNFLLGSILRRSIKRLRELELEIERKKEELERTTLLQPQARLESLYRDYRKIADASGRVFFESTKRYRVAQKWRREIGNYLERLRQNSSEQAELLNEVQYLLGSLKEIIDRELSEQRGQRLWQGFNLFIIFCYVTALAAIISLVQPDSGPSSTIFIPHISVPLWALIWGALGSLSAILYKFYIIKRRVRFSIEFQWLIARPIIGILMSAVAYIAVKSGLVLVGAEDSVVSTDVSVVSTDVSENSTRFTAIVCFLAGFSDRVYLGIIDLLVSKTLGLESDDEESSTLSTSLDDEMTDYYDRALRENPEPEKKTVGN